MANVFSLKNPHHMALARAFYFYRVPSTHIVPMLQELNFGRGVHTVKAFIQALKFANEPQSDLIHMVKEHAASILGTPLDLNGQMSQPQPQVTIVTDPTILKDLDDDATQQAIEDAQRDLIEQEDEQEEDDIDWSVYEDDGDVW